MKEEIHKPALLPVGQIGFVVKHFRTQCGYTQRELARRSGVSQSYICTLEKGEAKNVREDIVEQLADALGIFPMPLKLAGRPDTKILLEETANGVALAIEFDPQPVQASGK